MIQPRFKINPADVVRGRGGPYRGQALAMWQWFVLRLIDAKINIERWGTPFEYINGTSSINNASPYPICFDDKGDEASRRVRQLLLHAGERGGRGKFLRRIGFPNWASLDRPLIITTQSSREFPNDAWFEMQGRRFKGSPNSCHRQARSVQSAALELCYDARRWRLSIEYGYPHDASSWKVNIEQKDGERLDHFRTRVDAEIDSLLLPDPNPGVRRETERDWYEVHRALERAFYDDMSRGMIDWEDRLSDILVQVKSGSLAQARIMMTPARLSTLKRWAIHTRQKTNRDRRAHERKMRTKRNPFGGY